VAGAAAQIAAERFANLVLCWIRILLEQRRDRTHESGGAEAALRSTPISVSFLDGGQRAVLGDAFDSRDLRSALVFIECDAARQHRAREHRRAVDQYSAGAATGVIAAAL